MTLSSEAETDKIILLGLAESGKTTILKVVSEGYIPDKKAPYSATLDYTRKNVSLFGKTLTLFDLGGQKAFLDRFIGELAEFIFSGVKILIFVIDIVEVTRLSLAKYYLDLALKRIKQYSSTAAVYVFLHKTDLIDQTDQKRLTEYCNDIKTYLLTELDYPMTFFETSVFDPAIFQVFKDLLAPLTKGDTLSSIIDEFVKGNADLGTMAQIFTQDGQAFIKNGRFTHISPSNTQEILDKMSQYLANKKEESASSVFLETKDSIFFVQFLENNHVLLLSFSRTDLAAKQVGIPTLHNRVLLLTQKVNKLLSQLDI
ncbi:MAG: ADP-ribosylation factor-like protein [Promethearchaeota archaeon]